MRLGIFGGSFNPIHNGHLIVAEEVREKLRLDKVLFLLSFNPPHKRKVAPYEDRKAMLLLAIAGNPYFSLSEIEKERGGKSWTVDTLKDLRKLYPQDRLFLIIGSDQFQELESWKNPRELFKWAEVWVMRRPGAEIDRKLLRRFPRARIFNIPQIDIRGKRIREKIKKGLSVRYLLPNEVYQYILKRKLYKKERI
ncbi:MAG: nicotinate-nucleotide adenylyltransferase [candidate division WOR-3 bacterium]